MAVKVEYLNSQIFPSVLWHCWMGIRKSIQSVNNQTEWLGAGMVICLGWAAKLFACGPADATASPSFLALLKSRMVLPFWCRLTQVVLEKEDVKRVSGRLNEQMNWHSVEYYGHINDVQVLPTTVRSIGLGTCSSMARVGAILTPFIAQVGVHRCQREWKFISTLTTEAVEGSHLLYAVARPSVCRLSVCL